MHPFSIKPAAFNKTAPKQRRPLAQAIALATLIGIPGSQTFAALELEEIVVTAQKRAQSLQDVPIAISAVSGDSISSSGIAKMEDLAPSIPNFQFAEAVSGSDQLFMRGVGSGINFGFEMAVGQVIDGFFYGRSRFGRASFLDIERVEVLKGPQGALIGKNTSAGALNITTAKPTDEFEAWVSTTYEFEADEGYTVEGAVSGPLTDSLKARLAVRVDDRDGWVHNDITGDDQQKTEDITARLTFLWEPSADVDVTLAYQFGDFDREGRTRQLSKCGDGLKNFDPDGPGPAPAGALFNALVASGEDCKANFNRNVVSTRNGQGNSEGFTTEFDTLGLTVNWEVGEHTLTSLTGYAEYDTEDLVDIDATFAELVAMDAIESFEQVSQEFRIVSPIGEKLDYIAGVYLLHTEQQVDFSRHFVAQPPGFAHSNLIATEQESDTAALFGQVTFHLSETWDLTVGGRYTRETKDALQVQTPTDLFSLTPSALDFSLAPVPLPGTTSHTLDRDRTESNFSPNLNVQWQPDNDTMYYASISKGFKGGGFDMQLDGNQASAAQTFEFEEEEVLAYELGAKLTLAEGAAQLNLALFRSEFDDLQVSSLTGTSATFNVGNAASAITQGLEADLKWALTERLTLSAAMAYLDAEYDEFDNAQCNTDQLLNGSCAGGTQDLSGKPLQYAPDWSGTLSAEYVLPLSGALELTGFMQVIYSDEFSLALDRDPNLTQEDYTKVDARLTLSDTDHSWEISLIGRNLGDETTSNFGNDAIGGPMMAGTYFRMIDAPRSLALQGRLHF